MISPRSMMFYTGSKFPKWQGNILIGRLLSHAIIRLTLDGDRVSDEEVMPTRRRKRGRRGQMRFRTNAAAVRRLVSATFADWNEDKAPRLAAALAYYALFSLAPLLTVAIAVAGLVFGRDAVKGHLFGQIKGFVGDTGAAAIQELIKGASSPTTGIIATIVGMVTFLVGVVGLFSQLQSALNTIWEVPPQPKQGIYAMLRKRFVAFGMVLGTGVLLLISLVLSTALAAVGEHSRQLLPRIDILWNVIDPLISFVVTAGLFAVIFKVVPDADISWRDVWVGAAVTALLFSIGRFAMAQYLGRGSIGTMYGAAGSLVVVLLWTYYAAQILFLGAEFTQVYARTYGSRSQPASHAERVDVSRTK